MGQRHREKFGMGDAEARLWEFFLERDKTENVKRIECWFEVAYAFSYSKDLGGKAS